MNKKAAALVGLSSVLLFALVRLVLKRQAEKERKEESMKKELMLDTASEDSFPASDPPSWTAAQAAG